MRPTSALLIVNRIPMPPEVDMTRFEGCKNVSVNVSDDGTVSIEPGGDGTTGARQHLRGRTVVLTRDVLDRLPWRRGERLSIESHPGRIDVRRLDPSSHPDLTDPPMGPDGLPMPPQYLVQAFTSVPDRLRAIAKGERTARFILDHCAKHGVTLGEGSRFLDFGCGSGRVLRHMPRLAGVEVIGTDLYKDALAWCREHLSGSFIDGQENPPLPLEDDSVDAMLALSVLTHLDEEHCVAWLEDWKRVLKPGGLAFVTAHSHGLIERNFANMPERRERVNAGMAESGGVWFDDSKGWEGVFPEFYQTTYHSEDHIRSVWGSVMDIVEIVPSGGFTNAQDLVILRA